MPFPSFLLPWFAIAGLAAALGPLLIHLLNRRRFKVIEWAAMDFLRRALTGLGCEVTACPLSNAIRQDPDYSDPIPDIGYDGRFNLRVVRRGTGGGVWVGRSGR